MDSPQLTLPDPQVVSFTRDAHTLLMYTWENPGAPRMLIIHGIGMGHSAYDEFIAVLRDKFEVIAVDLPGFGDAPESETSLTIRKMADLVAAALAEVPVTAIGHSMGSQVAAEMAAHYPELVSNVVLIAPTVNPAERTAREQALRVVQDLGKAPAGVLAKGAVAYAKTGPLWFIKKLEHTIEHRIEDVLPSIEQPTLVLRGSEDPVSPHEWCVQVAGLLPDGELHEIVDHGHEAIISDGDPALKAIVTWLSG